MKAIEHIEKANRYNNKLIEIINSGEININEVKRLLLMIELSNNLATKSLINLQKLMI